MTARIAATTANFFIAFIFYCLKGDTGTREQHYQQ